MNTYIVVLSSGIVKHSVHVVELFDRKSAKDMVNFLPPAHAHHFFTTNATLLCKVLVNLGLGTEYANTTLTKDSTFYSMSPHGSRLHYIPL